MRRQLSDSAVISTGSPDRVYTNTTSWSLVGPPRTFTRSGFKLTKRGSGSPLLGPLAISAAACWAQASRPAARMDTSRCQGGFFRGARSLAADNQAKVGADANACVRTSICYTHLRSRREAPVSGTLVNQT